MVGSVGHTTVFLASESEGLKCSCMLDCSRRLCEPDAMGVGQPNHKRWVEVHVI